LFNEYENFKVYIFCHILHFILKIYHNFESYQIMLTTLVFCFLYHKIQLCFVCHTHYTPFTCDKRLLKFFNLKKILWVSQPYFGQVWGWSPTLGKSEELESSGTPECLELDSKGKNTSHWGVIGVIGKVLKRRYRKWPRIGHSDICRPSYGQKKGRESNWQFDSRPLKVGNRYLADLRFGSVIRRWKDLDEGYNFGSDLVAIRGQGEELRPLKVPRVQN